MNSSSNDLQERSRNDKSNANHDDSGTGRKRTAGANSEAISKDSSTESSAPNEESNDNISPRAEDSVQAASAEDLAQDSPEVREAAATLIAAGSVSYSGLLPRAEDFVQYPSEVQERMCRWNDAFTIDESQRQDRLVDNEIKQASKSMWITFVLFLVTMVLSFVSFIWTTSGWSFSFLAVPVMSMVSNMTKPVFSRSSREDNKNEESSS